jgi:hypothetical protein
MNKEHETVSLYLKHFTLFADTDRLHGSNHQVFCARSCARMMQKTQQSRMNTGQHTEWYTIFSISVHYTSL